MTNLLEVEGLRVEFPTFAGVVKVVNGVSFSIRPGEILGIVGETGSGKSLTLQAILGVVPYPGRVAVHRLMFDGRDLSRLSEAEMRAIRGKEIARIVSNPRAALNPVMRVGEQIANVILAHERVGRKKAIARAIDLIDAVGIPDAHLRSLAYPHELSGGMAQRIIIAMGLSCSPKLLLADEPTANLDVTVQRQILDSLKALMRDFNSASVLVTRDLGIVAHYCDRVAVMYAGEIVETCDVKTYFRHARHPYSQALLSATRAALGANKQLTLTGSTPDPINLPSGCPVHPRCPLAVEVCRVQNADLLPVASDHLVSCHVTGKPEYAPLPLDNSRLGGGHTELVWHGADD